MTLYAHVSAGVVDSVGQPPLLYFDGTRWWDLRSRELGVLEPLGWFVVTPTPRPADTDTTTYDYSVALVAGTPTEVWTARPWTAEELAARTAATNEQSLQDKARTALTNNANYLALTSPTNAQVAAQVKALTRQVNALIKLEIRELSDTSGT